MNRKRRRNAAGDARRDRGWIDAADIFDSAGGDPPARRKSQRTFIKRTCDRSMPPPRTSVWNWYCRKPHKKYVPVRAAEK